MNRVVEILMRRDGMSQREAEQLVERTRSEILDIGTNPFEVEEIIMDNLGLEPDYIMDII